MDNDSYIYLIESMMANDRAIKTQVASVYTFERLMWELTNA